jgi:hypothetical protein
MQKRSSCANQALVKILRLVVKFYKCTCKMIVKAALSRSLSLSLFLCSPSSSQCIPSNYIVLNCKEYSKVNNWQVNKDVSYKQIIYRISQQERSIFWEIIVSVILSKEIYIYMYPIPNGFRDRAITLHNILDLAPNIVLPSWHVNRQASVGRCDCW